MIRGFFKESIVKRAQDKGLVEIKVVNLRDFAKNSYGSVDDRPYGGGAGMVMRVDVVRDAIHKSLILNPKSKVLLTSVKGQKYTQAKAIEYSQLKSLIIVAAHYEGVDERVLEYIDEEVSIGDFVMTGGEIAAAAITDSVVRLLEDVLKKEAATQEESFFTVSVKRLTDTVGEHEVLANLKKKGMEEVQLLEYPHYTRPEEYEGRKVPEILLGGNHAEIQKWRIKKAFEQTLAKRPDLLRKS